jgi:hypothetical protein
MATARNGSIFMICKSYLSAAKEGGALDALQHLPELGGRLCARGQKKTRETKKKKKDKRMNERT